jgi:hypothetical protein
VLLPSSQLAQTRTGDSKVRQTDGFAVRTAAFLICSNDGLEVLGAGAAGLVLAALLVELVGFVVSTLEVDEALEAHL